MNPTIAGFLVFIRTMMGINSSVLPDNSPYIASAYQYALDIVSIYLAQVAPDAYTSAVYNLAGHNLIVWAQDQPVQISQVQASISGTVLDVTAFNSGTSVAIGAYLNDGLTLTNATILSQLTVVGANPLATGTYQLDGYYNIASEPINVSTPIIYLNGMPYFAYWRSQWNINKFVAGVLESTSDESTSSSFHIPEFMDRLPMSALEYLKTPYGREYLGYEHRVGGAWGMS